MTDNDTSKEEARQYLDDVKEGLILAMIEYEDGLLGEDQTILLFQRLIDYGLVWKLQGHYGNVAVKLIKEGVCHV